MLHILAPSFRLLKRASKPDQNMTVTHEQMLHNAPYKPLKSYIAISTAPLPLSSQRAALLVAVR